MKKRRSRGTGSLFFRNGGYVFQYIGFGNKIKTVTLKDKDGNKITSKPAARQIADRILQSHNEARTEAETLINRIEVVQKVASLRGILHRCPHAIADMLQAWKSSPHYTKANEVAKTSAIVHLQNWLQTNYPKLRQIAGISADVARRYMMDYWHSGVSARAYNVRLNMLHIVFRAFFESENPFENLPKKQESSESKQPFTLAQLAMIWAKLEDQNYYMLHKAEMRDIYILALHSGLRCSDCCLLLWDSVNLNERVISLTPKKTRNSSKRTVTIPMTEPLFVMLQNRHADRDDAYVFSAASKRYKTNPDGIYKDTQALLTASGIQTQLDPDESAQRKRPVTQYGFHSFRHTCASMLANNNVNPLVIRDILGHSNIAMTSHYSHISIESKREAVQCIMPTKSDTAIAQHMLSGLSVSRIPQLAEFLEAILSENQQRALRAFLA